MEWNLSNLPATDLEKEFFKFYFLLQQFASFHTHSFDVPYLFIHPLLYVLQNQQSFTEKEKKMAPYLVLLQTFLFSLFLLSGVKFSESARIFTIINHCKETVWPGVFPGENFNGGGFTLKPGQSMIFTAPVSFQGRIWGRTGCNFDKNGNGSCLTGDCGSSLQCTGTGKTPASLAEFTLASLDFYDVSLVDGFNVPMSVTPLNGKGNCSVAGCNGDLRQNCPSELSLKSNGKVIACRSACDVFNTDEYCCRGNYGNPTTCQPTFYSKKFKEVCPTAYSYAYDDPTSIFTCSGTDYVIAFCSSRKQSVCTYHDHKLVCSGSNGLRWSISNLWMIILGLTFIANFKIFF